MSELLPSVEAAEIRESLLDYLTTTFALSDQAAREALRDFLLDPVTGIFKGPFVRLRMPFRPAKAGWEEYLDWTLPYAPYGHQARAFQRLTTKDLSATKPRPLPTLVTTGTGSGKTEAFLYPILDHARRARACQLPGIKALILYPMNALANDQAQRIASLLTTHEELSGITAGLYIGQDGPESSRTTADGLITARDYLRDEPPDLLLTNYKMLDQLLLRAADQPLWQASATSLRYLVLDEFHTYDGAQGTDVAMLLRRLGIALKSYWCEDDPELTDADWARPLGLMTPVATSATLGDGGDPSAMLDFAETVFGEPFDADAVITESRLSISEWTSAASAEMNKRGWEPTAAASLSVAELLSAMPDPDDSPTGEQLARGLVSCLVTVASGRKAPAPSDLPTVLRAHPLIQDLAEHAAQAISLTELAAVIGRHTAGDATPATSLDALTRILGALSHVRATTGNQALSVETHLWVRELTRIDRMAAPAPAFWWSDDGEREAGPDATADANRRFPAIYCRHCGRSGWGIGLAQTGSDLASDDSAIRRNHANREGRFRALLDATREAEHDREHGTTTESLRWLALESRQLLRDAPDPQDRAYQDGLVLPVLTQVGPDADDDARDDVCPSCGQKDAIRFLGSAIATMLSVALSTLFGAPQIDPKEKKALVFTDSVQDAAHRAGFVEARSHSLTLRSALRAAVPAKGITLDGLVDAAMDKAGRSSVDRFRLIPPDLAHRKYFEAWWNLDTKASTPDRNKGKNHVKRRLLFDAELEFGLQSHYGRTLTQTGSASATVNAGTEQAMLRAGLAATQAVGLQADIDGHTVQGGDAAIVRWVRGTLEHMRESGAMAHPWLEKFIQNDGNRYYIWGGRPRGEGMPAFPRGRRAPAFPRVGTGRSARESALDPASSPQGWYAKWAVRCLGVPPDAGAKLVRQLFDRLERVQVLKSFATKEGGIVYAIPAERVEIQPIDVGDLAGGRHLLTCQVCFNQFWGSAEAVDQLDGAPCLLVRCHGHMARSGSEDNFYRDFYSRSALRRIVAREHSSLLTDAVRLTYEKGFKAGDADPSAPNVLVATPTLEMGIDIGDLSSVILASLPRTVASYLQRIGRAGRLTGNSLNLAFVTGRGDQLPRLGDPLSVINGEVRPPATFLSASEILRRQYLAFLIDQIARDRDAFHPQRATAAIGSAEPGTFLGDVIARAEGGHAALLREFLGTFANGRSAHAAAQLTQWATPPDGPGSSGLARTIELASARWQREIEELQYRIKELDEKLPGLNELAALPAASDDDKAAARVADAARRLTAKRIYDLNGEHWIAVLEEFGLLPNYTLIDDSVELEVEVSWIDPESGEFKSEPYAFERGSANALREFAPGATFYASGMEIRIDALDLGPQCERIRPWACCPNCGYCIDLEATGEPERVQHCPRCGTNDIADAAQRFDVVELKRVSSYLRRDEASITDGQDERHADRFSIVAAADLNPDGIGRQWFVTNSELAVTYAERLDIRWLNLGRMAPYGQQRRVAGFDVVSPGFRVCEGCGQLDRSTRVNVRDEHRPWCRYRNGSAEHVRTVALSRTMTTEGLVIRLPLRVTLADRFALPSLTSAILLGLRERFRGAPEHIASAGITQPVPGGEPGEVADALLLYDTVRGGTGYLADLAEPQVVWDVLRLAWLAVKSCECQHESRLACHRCLLPFTPPSQTEWVARSTAERHLHALLLGEAADPDADVPEDLRWETKAEAPPVSPITPLEHRFQSVFRERISQLGATVTERPGAWGNTYSIVMPGSQVPWRLEPQVAAAGSRPDFTLTCPDFQVPKVQIFTDGFEFHATPEHNRLADDAFKRARLRASGDIVVGITLADVIAAEKHELIEPSWLDARTAQDVLASGSFHYGAETFAAMTGGPIEFLLDWIQRTKVEEYRELSQAVPLLFASSQTQRVIPRDAALLDIALSVLERGAEGIPEAEGEALPGWVWRHDHVALAGSLRGTDPRDVDVAVTIDDREPPVGAHDYRASWTEWLRISNLLAARRIPAAIGTAQTLAEMSAPAKRIELAPATVAIEWQELVDDAMTPAERSLLFALGAHEPRVPLPDIGFELDGLPITVCWADQKLAAIGDDEREARAVLEAQGWRIVPLQTDAVVMALSERS